MGLKSLRERAETWDAIYGFPRPANQQYLSSYLAFLNYSHSVSDTIFLSIFSFLSTGMLIYIYIYLLNLLNLSSVDGFGLILTVFTLFVISLVWIIYSTNVGQIYLQYRREFQRETHGDRAWATEKDLSKSDVDLLRKTKDEIVGKGISLAPFRKKIFSFKEASKYLFLSLKKLSQSLVVFGPPGSGKSSTFFIPAIRQFASCGGAIVLDVKGELYEYTARYFANVYRLDVKNPYYSDWFNLFGECYRNPDMARRIAAYIVGLDTNSHSAKEPIWDQSAVSMLALVILYLCEIKENPIPADIDAFFADNPKNSSRFDEVRQKDVYCSPLNEAFEECSYKIVGDQWMSKFSSMPKNTFGSVKFNLDTALAELVSPKVSEILRPPNEEERAMGRREIKFSDLRKTYDTEKNVGVYYPRKVRRKLFRALWKNQTFVFLRNKSSIIENIFKSFEKNKLAQQFLKSHIKPIKKTDLIQTKRGTGIYIVISPSDAINMSGFMRVVFSYAVDILRTKKGGKNVLVALDEAGNVPLSKLPEGINTDRSLGLSYFLGYQDKNQPESQYGKEGSASFLGTVATNIYLPGVDDATAEMASNRIGYTTMLERSSSDARNNGLDNETLREATRKLMMPQNLTEQKWFTQCIIMVKGASPIRSRIPPDSTATDPALDKPKKVVKEVSEEVDRMLGNITWRHTAGDAVEAVPVAIETENRTSKSDDIRDEETENDDEEAVLKSESLFLPSNPNTFDERDVGDKPKAKIKFKSANKVLKEDVYGEPAINNEDFDEEGEFIPNDVLFDDSSEYSVKET